MNRIRKIDFYAQCVFLGLLFLSLPVFSWYLLMPGWIILGGWQLVSALLNTPAFIRTGYQTQIRNYWLLAATDLTLLFLHIPLERLMAPDHIVVVPVIALLASGFIAFWYLRIYHHLIRHQALRRELSGFTKSKC